MQKPFYLYHWRRSGGLVDSAEAQKDPQKYGHQIVEQEAASFIPGLYSAGRSQNIYGGGLYAAIDPVSTESFGGLNPDSWALLEMRIPAGFQVLDLRIQLSTRNEIERQRILQVLNVFSCPVVADDFESYVSQLLRADSLPHECADLVSHLISAYEIDAFFYGYTTTGFITCQTGTNRRLAAVFTSNTWLRKPGADANVYTSKTSGCFESRRRLENVFRYATTLHAITDDEMLQRFNSNSTLLREILKDRLPEAAGNFQIIANMSCLTSECVRNVNVAYRLDQRIVGATVLLTMTDVEKTMSSVYPATLKADQKFLHWSDLQGSPSLRDPEQYIKQNLFECADSETLAPTN